MAEVDPFPIDLDWFDNIVGVHWASGDTRFIGVGVLQGDILVSDDGVRWRAVFTATGGSLAGVAYDREHKRVLAVGEITPGDGTRLALLYKSEDYGDTWQSIPPPPPPDDPNIIPNNAQFTYVDYVEETKTVWACMGFARLDGQNWRHVVKSTNGGESWTMASENISAAPFGAGSKTLVPWNYTRPVRGGQFMGKGCRARVSPMRIEAFAPIFAGGTGVQYSLNAGKTWVRTARPPGLIVWQVGVGKGYILAATMDNGGQASLYTTKDGAAWTRVAGPLPFSETLQTVGFASDIFNAAGGTATRWNVRRTETGLAPAAVSNIGPFGPCWQMVTVPRPASG